MYNFKSIIMKRVIILSTVFLTATLTFAQVAINKDGSEPDANSILHVKGNGVNALYVDYSTGYVGLNNINPAYRLHLVESVTDSKNYGSVFEITGGSTSTEKYAAVYSYIDGTGGVNRAFEGHSLGANPSNYNVGISAFAKNAKYNYGLQGQTIETNTIAAGQNIGTFTEAGNCDYLNYGLFSRGIGSGAYNAGVYASSTGDNAGINYGIYATASNGGTGNFWSGYFNGKLNVDGSIYQNGTIIHSKSIHSIDNALAEVKKLKPVSIVNEYNELSFAFDAETMKTSSPDLVKEIAQPPVPGEEISSMEVKTSVNISAIIPILTKAIQELNEKVESLESENSLLKKEIDKLKAE
jgi:hypothetical protein